MKIWKNLIVSSKVTQIDAKTRLQEYSLKKYKILPTYKLVSSSGPKHQPSFKVAVKLKDSKFVEGSGNSKKSAEQAAAIKYLSYLNV